METYTVLIVDDEKEIRNLIQIYLRNEGYTCLVASNGVEALNVLRRHSVHLIILDIMMPKMDGIEACMKIREEKNIPIIMLSAKSEDMDKILGLATGADDYVTKPFNPLELVARVKSQIRRYTKLNYGYSSDNTEIVVGDLTVNIDKRDVRVSDRTVKLTPREFDILVLLAQNKGIVFSIERIYERVWKEDYLQSDNTVMVHIRKIREKIEENPRKPIYLKTVWGVGYRIDD